MGLVQSPHGPQFYMPDDLYVPTGDQPATLPQDMPVLPAQPGRAPGSPDGFQPSEDQKLLWAKAGGYATPSMEPIQVGQPAPPSPEVAAQLAAIPSAPTGPQAIPMHADSAPMGKALDTINGTAPAGVPSLAGAPTGGQLPSLAQTTSMGQAAINADKAATAAGTDAEVRAADAAQAEGVAGQQRLDQMEAQRRAAQAESERQHAIIDAHAAQLQKEADDYRIDPKAGYGGTGQKIGNLIAMALSGVGMALMGKGDQQNPVLAMINQHVKDSVDQQMDQRNQLQKRADRGLAAVDRFDQFSSNKNAQALAMQAAETQRIANKIKLAAGQYASASAKANGDKLIAGLDGQASKLWEGARQVAKAEADKVIEQANQRAQIGIAGGHLALAQRAQAWTEKKDQEQLDLEAAKLAQAGKADQAKQVATLGIGGVPVEVRDADNNVVGVRNDIIRNKDGSPFVAATQDEAKEIRAKSDATRRAVDAIDELRKIRNTSGWSSDVAKSADWQRAHSEASEALFSIMESKGLKRLSGDDINQVKELLGKLNDPTRYQDIEGGLTEARKIVVRDLNSTLKSQPGFDGEVKYPDLVAADKPALSAADERLQSVLANPASKPVPEMLRDYGLDTSSPDALLQSANAIGIKNPNDHALKQILDNKYQGVPPRYREEIDRLAALAAGGAGVKSADRQDAVNRLDTIMNKAEVSEVRDAARAALYGSFSAGIPMSKD